MGGATHASARGEPVLDASLSCGRLYASFKATPTSAEPALSFPPRRGEVCRVPSRGERGRGENRSEARLRRAAGDHSGPIALSLAGATFSQHRRARVAFANRFAPARADAFEQAA